MIAILYGGIMMFITDLIDNIISIPIVAILIYIGNIYLTNILDTGD